MRLAYSSNSDQWERENPTGRWPGRPGWWAGGWAGQGVGGPGGMGRAPVAGARRGRAGGERIVLQWGWGGARWDGATGPGGAPGDGVYTVHPRTAYQKFITKNIIYY